MIRPQIGWGARGRKFKSRSWALGRSFSLSADGSNIRQQARELQGNDNTVFIKGYPINYSQGGNPPPLQYRSRKMRHRRYRHRYSFGGENIFLRPVQVEGAIHVQENFPPSSKRSNWRMNDSPRWWCRNKPLVEKEANFYAGLLWIEMFIPDTSRVLLQQSKIQTYNSSSLRPAFFQWRFDLHTPKYPPFGIGFDYQFSAPSDDVGLTWVEPWDVGIFSKSPPQFQ